MINYGSRTLTLQDFSNMTETQVMGHPGYRSRRRNWTRSACVRSWSVSGPVSWHNLATGRLGQHGGWWMAYPVTLGKHTKRCGKTTISQGTWSKQLLNRRVTIWWTGVILIVVTLIAVNGGFIVVIHDERNEECSATCILLDILVQGYSSDWRTWFQAANWPIPISTFFVLGVPDP